MSQYWIVAVSTDGESPAGKASATKQALANYCESVFSLDVPTDLSYKNFDSLIKLLDDLVKLDGTVEGCLRRVEKQMQEFGCTDFSVINLQKKTKCSTKEYIAGFVWDDAKYPRSAHILETSALIQATVQKLDSTVRASVQTYAELKTAHSVVAQSKKEAPLVTRDLLDVLTPDVVKPDEFVETEHLTTVVVIVPRGGEAEFQQSYQTWDQYVVPESAKPIGGITDKESNTLWRVVMFKTAVENFRASCRGKRFTVRTFTYSAEKYHDQVKRRQTLSVDTVEQEKKATTICGAVFSDLLVAWMHVKALRTFVEAVLRFGVSTSGSPKFASLMLSPKGGKVSQIREALASLSGVKHDKQDEEEEFYPYVFLTMQPLLDEGQ